MATLAGRHYIDNAAIRTNTTGDPGVTDYYEFKLDKLGVELQVEGEIYKLSSSKMKQYIDDTYLLFNFDQASWDKSGASDVIDEWLTPQNASLANFIAKAVTTPNSQYWILTDTSELSDSLVKVIPVLVNRNHTLIKTVQGRIKRGYKLAFMSELPATAAQIRFYSSR